MNCEVDLDLLWKTDSALIEHHNYMAIVNFIITSTKIYVSVVTLSLNNSMKISENLKQRFKKTIPSFARFQSNISDYIINPTFTNINKLFFSFIQNW